LDKRVSREKAEQIELLMINESWSDLMDLFEILTHEIECGIIKADPEDNLLQLKGEQLGARKLMKAIRDSKNFIKGRLN